MWALLVFMLGAAVLTTGFVKSKRSVVVAGWLLLCVAVGMLNLPLGIVFGIATTIYLVLFLGFIVPNSGW